MKSKIKKLILLQDCDNKIKEIDIKKREVPIRVQDLEEAFDKTNLAFQEKSGKLNALKKNRRELEQRVQDLENKMEKSRVKLNNIKSNKEYSAVLKEIEVLEKEKTQNEDIIIQLMEQIETLEKQYLESRDEQEKIKIQFDQDKKEIQKGLEALEEKASDLENRRMEICEDADKELLIKYNFLKERKGGVALSSVIGSICQSCYIKIPPQQFNELIKSNDLSTCPNCNRLIYWGEDEFYIKDR